MRTSKLGQYTTAILIRTRSLAAADSLGEEIESWADGTRVWFAKREWLGSTESVVEQGMRASTKRARFTIHGLPTVSMVDQVKIKATGEVFNIETLTTNEYETIIEGSY